MSTLLKKKNYIFNIKSLINSNLLLINLYSNSFKNKKKLQNSFFFLEPLDYIKNLKQTIRVLQFLKNQKNSYIYIDIMDAPLKTFLILNLKKKKKKKNISFFS